MEYNKEFLIRPLFQDLGNRSASLIKFEEGSNYTDEFKAETKPSKGRKRNIIAKASNIYDLINENVIPKWKYYLKSKSERHVDSEIKPRADTIWKKILRDVREFYRILFRNRFHHLEFKDSQKAYECLNNMFDGIGISLQDKHRNSIKLFRYVHQTHKSKSNGNELEDSPFEVIEKYNENYRKLFMTDITWAQMFYFVYKNYLDIYCSLVKPKYRKEVITLICLLLNCYKKMKSAHHIDRICHLLN